MLHDAGTIDNATTTILQLVSPLKTRNDVSNVYNALYAIEIQYKCKLYSFQICLQVKSAISIMWHLTYYVWCSTNLNNNWNNFTECSYWIMRGKPTLLVF